jgi:hypothetical protein
MSMVGKFFFCAGKEYTQTGEIIEQPSPDIVLVRFDHCDHIPPTMTLVAVSEMVSVMRPDGSVDSDWEFFATREQLDTWMAWLETPPDNKKLSVVASIS